jgi:hypothetical protein
MSVKVLHKYKTVCVSAVQQKALNGSKGFFQ